MSCPLSPSPWGQPRGHQRDSAQDGVPSGAPPGRPARDQRPGAEAAAAGARPAGGGPRPPAGCPPASVPRPGTTACPTPSVHCSSTENGWHLDRVPTRRNNHLSIIKHLGGSFPGRDSCCFPRIPHRHIEGWVQDPCWAKKSCAPMAWAAIVSNLRQKRVAFIHEGFWLTRRFAQWGHMRNAAWFVLFLYSAGSILCA